MGEMGRVREKKHLLALRLTHALARLLQYGGGTRAEQEAELSHPSGGEERVRRIKELSRRLSADSDERAHDIYVVPRVDATVSVDTTFDPAATVDRPPAVDTLPVDGGRAAHREADGVGDVLRGTLRVASDHHHAVPLRSERRDRLGHVALVRVLHCAGLCDSYSAVGVS